MSTTADCWPYYATITVGRCPYCNQFHDANMPCPGWAFEPADYPIGWICPRCNKVHAPHIPACDCPPPTWTGTTVVYAYAN